MADSSTQTPRLGAVVYSGEIAIEPILAEVRDRLWARGGLRLGGVVPRDGDLLPNGRPAMQLDDVSDGTTFNISQDLGAGAEDCILDVDGLTRARMAIAAAIEAGVDLVMVGKFAKQEAAGHGVREEIGAAMIADIPILVALREGQLPAWEAFAGDDWQRLDPRVEPILDWVDRIVSA